MVRLTATMTMTMTMMMMTTMLNGWSLIPTTETCFFFPTNSTPHRESIQIYSTIPPLHHHHHLPAQLLSHLISSHPSHFFTHRLPLPMALNSKKATQKYKKTTHKRINENEKKNAHKELSKHSQKGERTIKRYNQYKTKCACVCG